jgi:hypothetical protein
MPTDVDVTFPPRLIGTEADGPPIGDGGGRMIIFCDVTIFALEWTGVTNATLAWTATGERAVAAMAAMAVRIFLIVCQESLATY